MVFLPSPLQIVRFPMVAIVTMKTCEFTGDELTSASTSMYYDAILRRKTNYVLEQYDALKLTYNIFN